MDNKTARITAEDWERVEHHYGQSCELDADTGLIHYEGQDFPVGYIGFDDIRHKHCVVDSTEDRDVTLFCLAGE